MKNKKNQEHNSQQKSLGFRIWIYFLCVVIDIAVAIFMIVSKLIILLLSGDEKQLEEDGLGCSPSVRCRRFAR